MRKVLPGLLVAVGLAAIIYAGYTPDSYNVYVRHLPPPYPFPLEGVATYCGILLIEAAFLWSILRPGSYTHSWGRAGSALLLSAALAVTFALGSMHTPPYYYAHFLWLVAMVCLLTILFIWSAAVRLVRHAT